MKTFNDSKSQHLEELEALISSSLSEKELEDRLSDYHDNDIAEILEKLTPQERLRLYRILGVDRTAEIFAYLDEPQAYFDELSVLFSYEWSTNFLDVSWKRYRKYGALASGIFQNLDQALDNEVARSMISNSEFLVLLNQAASDRTKLAELLHISDTQLSYVTDSEAGRGLLKMGGSLVPFINDIPKDTQLYKLMSTRPGEV